MRKLLVILMCFFVLSYPGKAHAGGAVAKKQQMQRQRALMQQQMMQQAAQQQAAQKAAAQKQAAQQAAAQQAAAQQAAAQQAAMQQAVAARQAQIAQQQMQGVKVHRTVNVHPQVQQRTVYEPQLPAVEVRRTVSPQYQVAGVLQSSRSSPVEQVADLSDVIGALEDTSRNWPLIMDREAKEAVVDQYVKKYRENGVVIRKAPGYYADEIDAMTTKDPAILDMPFSSMLKVVAILQYDFDNGSNKDLMALKILGSQEAVAEHKKRLGL